jgi:hypothetical protein
MATPPVAGTATLHCLLPARLVISPSHTHYSRGKNCVGLVASDADSNPDLIQIWSEEIEATLPHSFLMILPSFLTGLYFRCNHSSLLWLSFVLFL